MHHLLTHIITPSPVPAPVIIVSFLNTNHEKTLTHPRNRTEARDVPRPPVDDIVQCQSIPIERRRGEVRMGGVAVMDQLQAGL